MPSAPSVLASQATALTGEPCTEAPAVVLTISPFFSSTMPASARSIWRGLLRRPPSVKTPQEALSATVSWILIFQSLMRESTISKQGITQSVARSTSAAVTPGPTRSRARTNATSASALGAIRRPMLTASPSLKTMPESRWPKSGWFTPSMSITTLLVTPIFLPTTVSPASRRRWIMRN